MDQLILIIKACLFIIAVPTAWYMFVSSMTSMTRLYMNEVSYQTPLFLSREEFCEFTTIGIMLMATILLLIPVLNLVGVIAHLILWFTEGKVWTRRPFAKTYTRSRY